MRVAIVENTRITHHGQVGVALHEARRPDRHLDRPWSGQPLPAIPRRRRPGRVRRRTVRGGRPHPPLSARAGPPDGRLYRAGPTNRFLASASARNCWPGPMAAKTTLDRAGIRLGRRQPDRRGPRRPVLSPGDGDLPDLPVAFRHVHPAAGRRPPGDQSAAAAASGLPHRPRDLWHPVPFRGQPLCRPRLVRHLPGHHRAHASRLVHPPPRDLAATRGARGRQPMVLPLPAPGSG
jgi:hypothetical protein